MPLMPEGQSRRAWRRRVADYVLARVDEVGFARFFGVNAEDRREMIKVAQMLPSDVEIELFEDSRYPGRTYLEARLRAAPPQSDPGFKVIPPDQAVG
jgi:hypothetical protein